MSLDDKQDGYDLLVNKYDVRNCRLYNLGDVISRSMDIIIPNEDESPADTFGSRDVQRTPTKKARFGVAVVTVMLCVMIVIVILCWVFPAASKQTNSNITESFSQLHDVNTTVINSNESAFVSVYKNASSQLSENQ